MLPVGDEAGKSKEMIAFTAQVTSKTLILARTGLMEVNIDLDSRGGFIGHNN